MIITAEINDYSKPAQSSIRVHNSWGSVDKVELEIKGERYTVKSSELISAIKKCTLDVLGE